MTNHIVLLSLAANYEQKRNMAAARSRLAELLEHLTFSPERWTKPLGTTRRCRYLNQLAQGTTCLDADTLQQRLKELEQQMGRTDADRQEGLVRIDLDLLLFDTKRYHERDWERPYLRALLETFKGS